MPVTMTLESKGALFSYSGVVTRSELRGWRTELSGSPHLDNLRYLLHDCSNATFSPDVNERFLREMASLDYAMQMSNQRLQWVIAAEASAILTLIRVYNYLLPEPLPLHVFRTMDEARSWIAANVP